MEKINAIADVCPVPVIKAKKALAQSPEVEIIVDNEIATQNLGKLAEQKGFHFEAKQLSPKEYVVRISKGAMSAEGMPSTELLASKIAGEYIVVVDTDVMGRGDDQLGATLMKSFFYALTEQELLPKQVILYNGGVKFAAATADTMEDLVTLAEKGVEVYACGACTDFYGITSQIKIADITNMYRIIEMMREASRIVKP